jgi:ribonuclease Z
MWCRRLLLLALLLVVAPLCPAADAPVSAEAAASDAKGVIKLTFLGTGAPRPSNKRSGPAILVEAGTHRFLVDAGPATREQMFRVGGWELVTGLDTIFVTHLHYDHTEAIPNINLTGFMYGRRAPLHVYGPEGIVEMCKHFMAAYKFDLDSRQRVGVNLTGSQILATEVHPGVVLDQDGLKVTAFEVVHMPVDPETGEQIEFYGMSLGYRVDYKGRSVLFSGDTRSTPKSEILKYGKGVDVLVHEVQVPSPGDSPEAKLANISLTVHSTPAQAGYIFEHTKPRMAVYSHIIPPQTTGEELDTETKPYYQGPLMTAEDFMTITIGDTIAIGHANPEGTEVFEKSTVVPEKG